MGRIINYILRNPACIDAGKCLPCCGMCESPVRRSITDRSLFGECRHVGYCLSDCGGCYAIATDPNFRGRKSGTMSTAPIQYGEKKYKYVHMQHCFSTSTGELMCTSTNRLCPPIEVMQNPSGRGRPIQYAHENACYNPTTFKLVCKPQHRYCLPAY